MKTPRANIFAPKVPNVEKIGKKKILPITNSSEENKYNLLFHFSNLTFILYDKCVNKKCFCKRLVNKFGIVSLLSFTIAII